MYIPIALLYSDKHRQLNHEDGKLSGWWHETQ